MKVSKAFVLLLLCGVVVSSASATFMKKRRLVGDERTFMVVHEPKSIAANYVCQPGYFGPMFPVSPGLTGNLARADPIDLCTPPKNPQDLKGKIVLAKRGDCFFIDKVRYAEEAGAIGAVLENNVYSPEYVTMAPPGNYTDVGIPSCLISEHDAEHLDQGWPVSEEAAVKASATIKDGQTEILHTLTMNSKLAVYVDGTLMKKDQEQPGQSASYTIDDTYQVVAVHAKAGIQSSEDPQFVVHVSDGFSSSLVWSCTDSPAQIDGLSWENLEYDDSSWPQALVKTTPVSPHLKPANFIWGPSGTTDIYCRGYRNLEYIEVDGYQYKYFNKEMSWRDAETFCKEEAFEDKYSAHLASIHSAPQNMVMHALLPPYKEAIYGAWIGLNDIEMEGEFTWTDNEKVDYFNWREGEPNNHVSPDNLQGENCIQIDRTGEWNDLDCDMHKLPFICERFVGQTDDQPDEEQDDYDINATLCLIRWEEDTTLKSFMLPAQPLGDTTNDLCHYREDGLSCCTAGYVNKVVNDQFKWTSSGVTNERCLAVLAQTSCFACDANQAEYLTFTAAGITTAWCEDTCVTIWETCKDDPEFRKSPVGGEIENAKHLCDIIEKLDSPKMQFEVKSGDKNNCFRFDNLPPIVSKYTPEKKVGINQQILTIQFNEEVQRGEGFVEIYDAKSKKRHSVDIADKQLVTFTSTVWPHDTMHVAMSTDGKTCVFNGKQQFSIEIDALAVIDNAGNSWMGNKGEGRKWLVQGTGGTCKGGHSKAAVVLTVLLLLTVSVGGGAFYWRWKKKRDAALAYGIVTGDGNGGIVQEGDIVTTDEGKHQVRLVPVYDPASETRAARSPSTEEDSETSMLTIS